MTIDMPLKLLELLSIGVSALVLGVVWGPWVAVTRSIDAFTAEVFLALVHRMDKNLATLMTVLMPATLVSIAAVLVVSGGSNAEALFPFLTSFALFVVALIVTALVEVPIVKQIRAWTALPLPDGWQRLRDRWVSFHLVRVLAGFLGFLLLVSGAIFATG